MRTRQWSLHVDDLGTQLDELQQRAFEDATSTTQEAYPPDRRLRGERLLAFLDEHRFAVVATGRADGRPHATPGAYVVAEGPSVWLPTEARTRRVQHVRTTPWVALAISEGERDEHTVVLTEGPARVVDEASQDVERRWTEQREPVAAWVQAWIVVEPVRLFSYAAAGSRWSPI